MAYPFALFIWSFQMIGKKGGGAADCAARRGVWLEHRGEWLRQRGHGYWFSPRPALKQQRAAEALCKR